MSTEGKEIELFTPGTNKIVESVVGFCSKMGFPPEAAAAVMRAAQSYQSLKATIDKQKKLPAEQRKALIKTRTPLSSAGLKMVDDLVKDFGVPYNTISIIDGKPYVGAEGLRVLIQCDPRIVKSMTTEKVKGEWQDNNYIAVFKSRIEFWGGGIFEAIGAADLNELQARRERTAAPPSFVDMIAETRAERRASRKAISLPIGIAEDVEEGERVATADIPIVKPIAEEPKEPKNKAQLLAYAMSTYNLKKADVEQIVNLAETTDYGQAWKQIQATMTAPKSEAQMGSPEAKSNSTMDDTIRQVPSGTAQAH